ncbi:MAG: DUF2625 family protein [Myxococcota bacterium]
MGPRSIEELVVADSAWPEMRKALEDGGERVEVLPAGPGRAEATLLALQVTTHSTLGALAYQTGGILMDGGWVRLLGSGHPRLPRDLASWNGLGEPPARVRQSGALLFADDVLGGFFAINGGGLPGPSNHVLYLAPDTLEWEETDLGFTDFFYWLTDADRIAGFYGEDRWEGWRAELSNVSGNQAFSFYPPLWVSPVDAGRRPAAGERSRKAISVDEAWHLNAHRYPQQLGLR